MNEYPTDSKINKLILEILSAKKCIYSKILDKYIVFIHPYSQDRLYLDELESFLIEKYKSENYPTEESLDEELILEFFSTEDEDELAEIESKIKAYESLLKKRIKGSVQYLDDYRKISELKKVRDSLVYKKDTYKQFTAEYKAREEKYFALLCKCTIDLDGKTLWDNVQDLFDCFSENLGSIYDLLNQYLSFYLGMEPSLIRYIARHPFWRNYYISSDKGIINLFSRKTEDLSLDQLNLMAWSSLYSDINAMSLSDRPSREVIENDELLDQYLEEYHRKVSAEAELVKKKDSGTNSKAFNHGHVVVTPESSNYVSFQKKGIYSDPKDITSRAGDESTSYNESKEVANVKKKIAKLNK